MPRGIRKKRSLAGQCLKWGPIGLALSLGVLVFSHTQIHNGGGSSLDATSLMRLVQIQNETIVALRDRLVALSGGAAAAVEAGPGGGPGGGGSGGAASPSQQLAVAHVELGRQRQELDGLRLELARAQAALAAGGGGGGGGAAPPPFQAASPVQRGLGGGGLGRGWNDTGGGAGAGRAWWKPLVPATPLDEECEARFGLGLSDLWRGAKEAWCVEPPRRSRHRAEVGEEDGGGEGGGAEGEASSIHCYPYQQEHKRSGPRKQRDMFCEGRNIFVDFSKVGGSHSKDRKPPLGAQYLSFGGGATFAACAKTRNWAEGLLMPHMARQLGGKHFHDNTPAPAPGTYEVASGSTYLLARDEDCENMFHSSADHLNVLNVKHILGLDFETLQVVLFDRHFDGPFHDLIGRAFSPNKPLKRSEDYKGRVVKFEHVVWHLESPAGLVFPKVGGPAGLMRCRASTLWQAYRTTVLAAFGLLDVPPPPGPRVLLSFRRRTATKNTGRVFENEKVLTEVLSEGDLVSTTAMDLGSVPFAEQLKLVRAANILVGAHGAGMMHVLFMAEEGVLVEIHPSYRLDRHFRLASRMAGKVYLPMRSTGQVSCRGSSDAIPVDKEEFRRTVDAAVRIARSFDDGASECGLKCDPRILALDKGNDPLYRAHNKRKATPFNTKFPCH